MLKKLIEKLKIQVSEKDKEIKEMKRTMIEERKDAEKKL